MYLLEDKHSEAATQWCFIQKVFLKFSQNSLENNYAGVSNCRPETCNFIKKETRTQVFLCKFCEIFQINFLWNTSGGSFWNIYRGTPVIPYNQLYWNLRFPLVFFWKFDSYSKDTFFLRSTSGTHFVSQGFFTVPLDVPTFCLFDSFFQFFCCTCFLGNLSFFFTWFFSSFDAP